MNTSSVSKYNISLYQTFLKSSWKKYHLSTGSPWLTTIKQPFEVMVVLINPQSYSCWSHMIAILALGNLHLQLQGCFNFPSYRSPFIHFWSSVLCSFCCPSWLFVIFCSCCWPCMSALIFHKVAISHTRFVPQVLHCSFLVRHEKDSLSHGQQITRRGMPHQ